MLIKTISTQPFLTQHLEDTSALNHESTIASEYQKSGSSARTANKSASFVSRTPFDWPPRTILIWSRSRPWRARRCAS